MANLVFGHTIIHNISASLEVSGKSFNLSGTVVVSVGHRLKVVLAVVVISLSLSEVGLTLAEISDLS